MEKVKATISAEIEVTPEMLAEWFCALNDDGQARFIVAVDRTMRSWGAFERDSQIWSIGGHLRSCGCSTPEAVEFVTDLAIAAKESNHA